MPPVAALIVAAGLGRRFGRPKATAIFHGRPLLAHVTDLATAVGLSPVLAVVQPGPVVPEGVTPIPNANPERGLSSSLRLGIAAVPESHAALILLVDQPTMPVTSARAVLSARGTHPIVAAEAGGRLAPPVLIEPEAFRWVAELRGDIGLREVFTAHPELVRSVVVPSHPPDVDTVDDLARLEAGEG